MMLQEIIVEKKLKTSKTYFKFNNKYTQNVWKIMIKRTTKLLRDLLAKHLKLFILSIRIKFY